MEQQTLRGARLDPVLAQALTDAIRHLDDQLVPALTQLVERRANVQRELRRYERNELQAPDPALLERLRRLHDRLQTAIDDCVQQAANAYAMLVALLQEGGDESVARRARAWSEGLTGLYDSLVDVLRGADDPLRADAGADRSTSEGMGAEAASPVSTDQPTDDATFRRQVEDALNDVRDLGRLAECELVARLPRTIGAICKERRNGHGGDPTSLEQAQAMSDVLRAAIERLHPADAPEARDASDRVMASEVLADRYLRGLSPRQIMSRRNISESTVHRYRREGIRVVARELREQEALYEDQGDGRRAAQP